MSPTARADRRAATLSSIKTCALDQLAARGIEGLSLRSVARELGMVSSGIYRYYPSRDALLTDLILDGYRDLAAALDRRAAHTGSAGLIQRATRLRRWAVEQPARFLLVFGTPIAGYEAPEHTIDAAREMYRALLRPIGAPDRALPVRPDAEFSARVRRQALDAAEALGLSSDAETVARGVGFATQVIGIVVLELNGQLRGSFDPAEAFFGDTVRRLAADVLPELS